MEVKEIPNIGWPLGLGNMNARIRVAAPPQPASASRHRRSSSFSSFSSSDLDTESTASFFPDQSVSLGRLIGIQAGNNKGRLRRCENEERPDHAGEGIPCSNHSHNSYGGICAPLLHHVIGRIGRSSRH